MRKLATAAAVSLILASSGAHALGLGDIEMRSALNQPMNAQIRLTSVQPGEADGMLVTLAAPDAFNRAGIERSQVLQSLQFTVDYEGPSPVIRISSSTPVVEPFLNFLLEVQWPTGRMVREYTVLLDPPVFMTPNATARNTLGDSPVLVERGEQAIVAPTPIERNTNLAVAEEFDESSVVVIGSAEETLDSAGAVVDLNEAFEGEEIALDEIPLEDVAAEGEVISLTDLGAANTEALETISTSELQPATVEYDFPEVELVGGTEEVSNDFVVEDGTQLAEQSSDSEVVSLEDLAGEEVAAEEFAVEEFSVSLEEIGDATGEITVQRGQTLGEIANDNAVSGVSTQQMLMALLKANEGAFINNNVNLVKAGAILRIPDAAEAQQMSQAQAVAQLGEQNQLWREYRDSVRSKNATQVALNNNAGTDSAGSDSISENTSTENLSASDSEDTSSSVSTAQATTATNELKIVAGDEPVAGSSSATSAEDEASAKLGDINRQLQLTREELASTKLESNDLGEQVASLEGTGEDLNTLVKLRQNEVAQLQEQLKNATAAQEADVVDSAKEELGGAVDQLNTAVEEAEAKLDEAGEGVVNGVTDSVADAAGAVTDVTEGVTESVADAAGTVSDAGTNALTEAGQTLGEVDLVDSATTEAADATAAAESAVDSAATQQPEAWYQKLVREYGKLGIMGILGLCAVGLMALLFRKKRKPEDRLDFTDEVEFIDQEEAESLSAENKLSDEAANLAESGVGAATGAAAAAGAAAVGGAAAGVFGDDKDDTIADVPSADALDDELDGDSTISEIDVYLAYGLHSQAEELLTKAVDSNPDNPEYAEKLLQTYHAQGNTEAFNAGAVEFQQKFGEDNEHWRAIANMGHEIQPSNALYAAGGEAISRMGTGDLSAPKLESDDFVTTGESTTGSVNRDFSNNEAGKTDGVDLNDESTLMDESLDPGFAFDEADLEATGDFSEAASAITEDNGSIDFPEFDKTDVQTIADDGLDGALTLDELDIGDATAANGDTNAELGSLAEDLTLDLDKLSGDLELDTTELLDGTDVGDLEIPDLTSDNELLTSAGGADEMDTMMDLAKAYIDMGDKDSASSTLGEIVKSGNPAQVSEAETLLRKIS